jgi:hypothetical protein
VHDWHNLVAMDHFSSFGRLRNPPLNSRGHPTSLSGYKETSLSLVLSDIMHHPQDGDNGSFLKFLLLSTRPPYLIIARSVLKIQESLKPRAVQFNSAVLQPCLIMHKDGHTTNYKLRLIKFPPRSRLEDARQQIAVSINLFQYHTAQPQRSVCGCDGYLNLPLSRSCFLFSFRSLIFVPSALRYHLDRPHRRTTTLADSYDRLKGSQMPRQTSLDLVDIPLLLTQEITSTLSNLIQHTPSSRVLKHQ